MGMKATSLLNKKILVTGASSGIGESVVKLLATQGASLIITGRNEEKLSQLKKELQDSVSRSIAADLSVAEGVERIITECEGLDGVVHCAGIVEPTAIKFLKQKHIQKTFAINFEAPVLISSGLLAKNKINKNASFVFISSVSSLNPYPGSVVYSASKSALEAYSRSLALELASQGIRSNCIAPAMVKTPMFDKFDDEKMKEHGENYPLGFGEPIDVANAVSFLLSDASSWVTGTRMVLDGGLSIQHKK